jgi:hypothetical protein
MLKGLTEIYRMFVFTVEKILDCGSSNIAEILRIGPYVGELIYKKPNSIFQLFNKLEMVPILSHHYCMK